MKGVSSAKTVEGMSFDENDPEGKAHLSAFTPFVFSHRAPIVLLAARNKVPAVNAISTFARDGAVCLPTDSIRRISFAGLMWIAFSVAQSRAKAQGARYLPLRPDRRMGPAGNPVGGYPSCFSRPDRPRELGLPGDQARCGEDNPDKPIKA
jgi:hypothetical protein